MRSSIRRPKHRGETVARYIQCNTCKLKSYNENDIREAFCGRCNKFHDGLDDYTIGVTETQRPQDRGKGST